MPTIRPAAPDDLEAIGGIYAHYVAHSTATFELAVPDTAAWTERFRAITGAGLPFLVVALDGKLAGYAYCTPWKAREAYRHTAENSIYLAPWATGRGLGGPLLAELVTTASAAGIRELIAVIADTGDPASALLHRRHGFTEAGRLRRVGRKHDRWLDTILMQRALASPAHAELGARSASAPR